MPVTKDEVSVMIHKVGPLLILDDGPSLSSSGAHGSSCESGDQPRPLHDNSNNSAAYEQLESKSQLMLAALDPSVEKLFLPPPGLPPPLPGPRPAPPPELGLGDLPAAPPDTDLSARLYVKNTFLDLRDEEEEPLERTRSAPACMGAATPFSPAGSSAPHRAALENDLQQRAERAASSWQLIPYEGGESGLSLSCNGVLDKHQWDLLQCSPSRARLSNAAALEEVRALFSDLPPQPSRFGRAVEWRCGPYKILLGCDLVVLHSADKVEPTDFASFKVLPQGEPEPALPSREERLDVYLENLMCDITKVVWGNPQPQGQATSWRIYNTADLPAAGSSEDMQFDPKQIHQQGQQLLHFLRQQCHREGGTYWLFREQNSPAAELFDLTASPGTDNGSDSWASSAAFRTSDDLASPIASLCFHLAKSLPHNADRQQLLQKGLNLLEPCKEEQFGMYSMIALQLASSYMRAPVAAISDSAERSASAAAEPLTDAPAAGRMSMALRYLERVLRLLSCMDPGEQVALQAGLAGLLLEAQVAYAECIVKLVREAIIPIYTGWLAEVQQSSQEVMKTHGAASAAAQKQIGRMKQLSAAYLLWRLFWACRAQHALSFLAAEKREVECWKLDRDLCEVMGDTLYGLSRYPADDVDNLLGGQMASAEGICDLVAENLRSWGMRGETAAAPKKSQASTAKKRAKRLTSPSISPADSGDEIAQPHNVSAMFLSKMNPLKRDIGDRALKEDPMVRDDLRPAFWTEGQALKRSLALYERATARLRKAPAKEGEGGDPDSLKVARKLAHLYNEEARAALVAVSGGNTEKAEELLTQAHQWMVLSGDNSNASRVLLNLSELHARRAERATAASEHGAGPFTEAQYQLFIRCIECCEEAATLSDGALGRREGSFAHLRLAVHLSVRVPVQVRLDASRREDTLAELADKHFGKALRGFDELKDDRELAVCHFHMADLALQEQKMAGAPVMSKARLTSALRHARRSAEYWERCGALQHSKDFVSSHVRIARLLECQQRHGAASEAVLHLSDAEIRLLKLAESSGTGSGPKSQTGSAIPDVGESMLLFKDGSPMAVQPIRREMGRICQAGIRQGEDIERLKVFYRQVLRNEPLA
eukprot:TRINITY_DN39437_c0_g1_i3.p1 TRINITY_DN39437_c0_g1~~TRINITY_DN39437_c0_g1_i3.p1  ORF type:complete len:1112 (+),score=235.86 TRINITY_DN39437_c0_g1_i3:149-3484(+)